MTNCLFSYLTDSSQHSSPSLPDSLKTTIWILTTTFITLASQIMYRKNPEENTTTVSIKRKRHWR